MTSNCRKSYKRNIARGYETLDRMLNLIRLMAKTEQRI